MRLYDRTGGAERLIPPAGEERVRSRVVFYRKREPTTAVMLDWSPENAFGHRVELHEKDVIDFVTLVRQVPNLSDYVSRVPLGRLPPVPQAFDGIDVFVLAGNRLAEDPPGRAALRHWVEQGGALWVMLDLVDPAVIAPILGDDAPLTFVDRLGLTSIHLHRSTENPARTDVRELENPVELVRVIPSSADHVLTVANGWPAAFTRRLG